LQVLFLSIMAKCGVFTHVRDLAVHLQNIGVKPLIGFIHDANARILFQTSKSDLDVMEHSLGGIPCFYFESRADLIAKLSDREIQMVHAHSPLVFQHAAFIKSKLGIPLIITLHGIMNWSRPYSDTLRFADRVIAIGPEVAASSGNEFRKKVRIIFNGIDTEYYKPNENKITDQTLRLVWIGRTSGSAARGVGCLAASINMLRKKGIPIEAKIIGNPIGPNLHGLEYHGWIHDPLPILQWSSIAYGRGRSLREAMSCGNAGFLLAEGYGGLVTSKWFEHGRQPQLSGSLKHGCAELDPIQIAKDMLYFHKNRESLQAAGVEARKIAEDYFDIRKMAAETKKLYEEALY
jgi:glycosyltransferase involved in cell wall biosynthesis